MRAGIPVADLSAGLYAAIGVMVALLARGQTGEGQWVQTSLLQAQISMLDFQAERWLLAKEVPPQSGNNHPTGIPTGVFRTKDGHINIAATGTAIYQRFCEVMGREDWLTDERFNTPPRRSKNRDEMNGQIEAITATKTSREWIEAFNEAGVPAGYIYSIDEVFQDPQVQHLGMAAPVAHPTLGNIELVAQPVHLSGAPSTIRTPTPDIGEHNDEVLSEAGYTPDEIHELRKTGAI